MWVRISAGMSRAIKMRMSHQFAPDHIQRLLRGPLANTIAITEELSFQHLCLVAISQRRVDQANRFLLGAASGSGDSGDADSQGCLAAFADTFRQGRCHLAADGSVLFDQ